MFEQNNIVNSFVEILVFLTQNIRYCHIEVLDKRNQNFYGGV